MSCVDLHIVDFIIIQTEPETEPNEDPRARVGYEQSVSQEI